MDHKKYITEKGTIHYWVNICTPEKKWIVFLPGLTADHSLFDSQVECFSKNIICSFEMLPHTVCLDHLNYLFRCKT